MQAIQSRNDGCVSFSWQVLGPMQTNVYVLDVGPNSVVVCDPAAQPTTIMEMVGQREVAAIFITHKHHDHIGALAELAQLTDAPVYASKIDAPSIENPKPSFNMTSVGYTPDVLVEHGESITVGQTTWQVLATPGHTPGSVCYYLASMQGTNAQGAPVLLSGDTLFYGTIGRTDFEGGSMEEMSKSLRVLGTLPDETIVCPGHDMLTTIGAERVRVIDYLGA